MSRVDADLEALKELREAVVTFTNRQKEVLEAAEREINVTITMVDEAERYWHYQVEERQHYLEQCQMEAAMAAAEGYYVDCSSYAYALREAEESLANIQRWQRRVDETVAAYHRGQGKIAYLLDSD